MKYEITNNELTEVFRCITLSRINVDKNYIPQANCELRSNKFCRLGSRIIALVIMEST